MRTISPGRRKVMNDYELKTLSAALDKIYEAMVMSKLDDQVEIARKKAVATGNVEDLHEYLRLRKENRICFGESCYV